jgi:hypothetical protein
MQKTLYATIVYHSWQQLAGRSLVDRVNPINKGHPLCPLAKCWKSTWYTIGAERVDAFVLLYTYPLYTTPCRTQPPLQQGSTHP